ncbi:class I SAM-dependent methyltransferase [Brachybacterium sp. EF45031]|uniref:class I SAM-dependent methyltransferase n=1 Tax=Brachybacterium sillae TaxID=2810536 RepID=UPI00217E3C89|nr:class I SAM-dependent methyltransferase [Brachybacterium sillae]MCS6710618.1 class I SAM-dependent methyltransferase [Brachybacterium sillae]
MSDTSSTTPHDTAAPGTDAAGDARSLEVMVRNLARTAHAVLDLSAEPAALLRALGEDIPAEAVAAVSPSAEDGAAADLESRGIRPVAHDPSRPGASLPFAEDRFDLVVSRGRDVDPEQVARILTPGGHVLIHRTITEDAADADPVDHLQNCERGLVQAGLRIVRAETHHEETTDGGREARFVVLARAPEADTPAGLDRSAWAQDAPAVPEV